MEEIKAGDTISWDYTETTTPTAPGDSIAGGGDLSVTLRYKKDEEFLQGSDITFKLPGTIGELDGWVRTSSFDGSEGSETVAELSIPTLMTELSVNRVVPLVMEMRLDEIVTEYINTVFTNPPAIRYEASNLDLYTFISWEGNVWDGLCSLASMTGIEITTDGKEIIIRDVGVNIIELPDRTPPKLTFDEGNVGRFLEITYTNQKIVESIGDFLENKVINPSIETNTTGWSVVNDTKAGITNTSGRTSDWKAAGGYSYRQRQAVTNYNNGTLTIVSPSIPVTEGEPLYASIVGYLSSNRMASGNSNTYNARLELRNVPGWGDGTLVSSEVKSATRGGRVTFTRAAVPTGVNSVRIVLYRSWTWNG